MRTQDQSGVHLHQLCGEFETWLFGEEVRAYPQTAGRGTGADRGGEGTKRATTETGAEMSEQNQIIPVPVGELVKLRRDAARYRFLRDSGNEYPLLFVAQRSPVNTIVQFRGDDLERILDAAMDKARLELKKAIK